MATIKAPTLNLKSLLASNKASGDLSINIRKEGDKVRVQINSNLRDDSSAPLSNNISSNSNYPPYEGTPAEIKTAIEADLGLGKYLTTV